jgi:hypothetical protein
MSMALSILGSADTSLTVFHDAFSKHEEDAAVFKSVHFSVDACEEHQDDESEN